VPHGGRIRMSENDLGSGNLRRLSSTEPLFQETAGLI